MHNEVANGKWLRKLKHFWEWLSKKIYTFKVQVLMGDFNMSLFRVVPELREKGIVIDLGAWYPWKSLKGEPMSDSCGIFFVGLPGVYALNKNISDLHDQNIYGVLKWAKNGTMKTPHSPLPLKTMKTMETSHPPPTVPMRNCATILTKVKT